LRIGREDLCNEYFNFVLSGICDEKELNLKIEKKEFIYFIVDIKELDNLSKNTQEKIFKNYILDKKIGDFLVYIPVQ